MLRPQRSFRQRLRKGFTLLEIIIVVGLMAALAAVLFQFLFGTQDGANREVVRLFVGTSVNTPLQTFKLNMRRYPTTDEGLQALVKAPSGAGGNWAGPYIDDENALVDPWGNAYRYQFPGKHNTGRYDVWSLGPDGQDGTADDIGNW